MYLTRQWTMMDCMALDEHVESIHKPFFKQGLNESRCTRSSWSSDIANFNFTCDRPETKKYSPSSIPSNRWTRKSSSYPWGPWGTEFHSPCVQQSKVLNNNLKSGGPNSLGFRLIQLQTDNRPTKDPAVWLRDNVLENINNGCVVYWIFQGLWMA